MDDTPSKCCTYRIVQNFGGVNFWQMKLEDDNILVVECNAGYYVM